MDTEGKIEGGKKSGRTSNPSFVNPVRISGPFYKNARESTLSVRCPNPIRNSPHQAKDVRYPVQSPRDDPQAQLHTITTVHSISVHVSEGKIQEYIRATAFLVLSITLWWYSYSPCEKFIRTEKKRTYGQMAKDSQRRRYGDYKPILTPAFLSSVSFSTELVFGPI